MPPAARQGAHVIEVRQQGLPIEERPRLQKPKDRDRALHGEGPGQGQAKVGHH